MRSSDLFFSIKVIEGLSSGDLKILIVEDRTDVALMLGQTLRARGFRIRQAESIGETRAILNSFKPNLVFLDLNLPDGMGHTLIPDLKNNETQIIIMSALNQSEVQVKLKLSDVDAYLGKPFTSEKVYKVLDKLTNSSGTN